MSSLLPDICEVGTFSHKILQVALNSEYNIINGFKEYEVQTGYGN